MNSVAVKQKIIALMKNNKKSELIKFLQECGVNADLKNEYQIFEKEQKDKNNDIAEYKYCGPTNSPYFDYFINEKGKMQIKKTEKSRYLFSEKIKEGMSIKEISSILNIVDSYELKLKNGHIEKTPEKINKRVTLALEEDIYKFMEKAGWLENDASKDIAEELKLKLKDKKSLEIHHISNRPDDNRVDNLVWLPKSIHCQAHKYTRIYTFELKLDEYTKVEKFIKDMRKKKTNL